MKTLLVILSIVFVLGCEKSDEQIARQGYENACPPRQHRQIAYVESCWYNIVFGCNGCVYTYTDGGRDFRCD